MGKANRELSGLDEDLSFEQTFAKAVRKGISKTWMPSRSSDSTLSDLMHLAFDALVKEDAELAGILGARGTLGREYQGRGAPGLSYWVFEHNLVYEVFKAWARSYRVLWDERLSARWNGPFQPDSRQARANDNQPRSLIDLQVVVDKDNDERWLFEMQWLNNPIGVRHAKKDASKLRELVFTTPRSRRHRRRAFLLGIWSNVESHLSTDFKWLRTQRPADTTLAFLGILPSPKGDPDDRSYHFLALLEVEA